MLRDNAQIQESVNYLTELFGVLRTAEGRLGAFDRDPASFSSSPALQTLEGMMRVAAVNAAASTYLSVLRMVQCLTDRETADMLTALVRLNYENGLQKTDQEIFPSES